jgi:hypothetical protein
MKSVREFANSMTPGQARDFIRKVMGPPKRTLEGDEHDQVWFLLQLTEPVRTSNNQHSWCEEYQIGEKKYDVHYFPNQDPYIEEYLQAE